TSLRELGADSLPLYMLHAVDDAVPFEESVGALRDLRSEGKIQMVGVGNVGRRQLTTAMGIVDIVAVENQLSPWWRSTLPLAAACAELGVALFAWSPLGRGRASRMGQELPTFAEVAR